MATDNNAKPRKRTATLVQRAWEQFDPKLQRYLMQRLHRSQDAEDLAQEVYLRLLRCPDSGGVRNYRAYIYRIASHVLFEYRFRSHDRKLDYDSDAVAAWGEKPPIVEQDEMGERLAKERQLQQMLARLPPTCQAVFLSHKRDGRTYSEVAEELGLSVHTVQKYVYRALAALRAMEWDE